MSHPKQQSSVSPASSLAMGALSLIFVLALSTPCVWSAQFYCVGEDCKNVTLFLGPKFGSKTIQLSPLRPNVTKIEDIFNKTLTNPPRKNVTSGNANFWGDLVRGTSLPNRNQEEMPRKIIVSRVNFTTTARPWRRTTRRTPLAAEREPRVEFWPSPTGKPPRSYPRPVNEDERPVGGDLVPRVRPVLDDGTQTIDFSGDDDIVLTDQDYYRPRYQPSFVEVTPNFDDSFSKGRLNLTGFGLSGDGVKEVLSNMSKTSPLFCLMLNNNNIHYFPTLTFPVELEYSVTQLWLDNNPLHYISPTTRFEISRLGNLKVLSLANTSISYTPAFNLPLLEALYLTNNKLTQMPNEVSPYLRDLHLANNHISNLIDRDLHAFPNLRVLDLSSNGLSFIFDHPFVLLDRLQTLYLNNNSLGNALNIDVPSDAVLFLADNPFICSCHLSHLVNQPWPYVVDKEKTTCTDDDFKSFRPVTSLNSWFCEERWTWWKEAGRRFEETIRWLRRHGITWENIGNFLYWSLIPCALLVIIKLLWTRKHKTPHKIVSYNLLDDKHVPYTILDDKLAILDDKNTKLDNHNSIPYKQITV